MAKSEPESMAHDPERPAKRSAVEISVVALVISAIVLALDLATGREVACGVLYTTVVLLGLWAPQRSYLPVAATASTLLTIGALLPDPFDLEPVTIFNHLFALVAIWGSAGAVYMYQRTERSLSYARSTRQLYLDMAGGLIVALDLDGHVTRMNRNGCELLGYEESELLGKPWIEEFVPEVDRGPYVALFNALRQGRLDGVERYESKVTTRSGEQRIITWHHTLIHNELGRVIGTLGSGVDITARRKVEQELYEQKALARIGQLAAIIAHEVRNAIAGMDGALTIIGERLPAGSEERAVLGSISARAGALFRMVEDLLLYARPRSLRIEPCDLRSILKDTATHLARNPTAKGVEVNITGTDMKLDADESQLGEAFLNLFLNAGQAMNGSGRVDVSMALQDRFCVVEVIDRGPGIPAEVKEKIFEPFFTTKHHGTGLGLPVAKRIVEAHGGELTCDTPPGGGTVMRVQLPRVRA